MMFIDKLEGLVDHPYIVELANRDKANLEKRIEEIQQIVKFEKEGDYVNMINPF